ncbi:MAG: sodium/hydrogen exchanger [Bacilli bacterium]|nr:sodium/hydrogen exchanger [Bacilli bacterium]
MHSVSLGLAEDFLSSILILLLAGTAGGKLADWLRVPDVVLFLVLGMLLGPAGLGWVQLSAGSTANTIILLFGAAFILFHGGLMIEIDLLKQVWPTVTLLSTVGLLVTALVAAVAAVAFLHLPLLAALLLGSILASTDPASLVPIFQRFPIRAKVSQTVIMESAFTDATGTILTTVILSFVLLHQSFNWGNSLIDLLRLAVFGIAIGGLIGFCAAFLISEQDRGLLKHVTPMVVVLTVLSAYLLAEKLHASGFMSVFTAGIVVGNAGKFGLTILPQEKRAGHQFIDAIGLKLRMLIFLLLGSQMDFSIIKQHVWASLCVVLVFMLIARPLTVFVSLLPDRKAKWQREEILFFCWTRETGVIAATLAGIVSSTGIPEGQLVFAVTLIAILLTVLLQGGTTPLVAKKLSLLEDQKDAAPTH